MSARLLSAAILVGASTIVGAQNPTPPPEIALDAAARAEAIDGVLKALNEVYVYPDVAKKMEEAVRLHQKRGEYESVTNGRQLAQLLTDHLREVSRDRHLGVTFTPQSATAAPPPVAGDAQSIEDRQRTIAARQNFGFVRVERLSGNIGYVELLGFMRPAFASDTATAAMNFVANTDAVIFDLRRNGGGDPAMVAFITSYLFGPQPVHLNDFYLRPSNETRPSWTLPHVPGRRLTGKDVYILTSERTFSGAEEFTYNLKHLKRAIVVGETTGGGAHLVMGRQINQRFAIGIPAGRPINAITKTDWEGSGVEPDVKVPAEDALKTAHLLALEKQLETLPATAPGLRNEANGMIPTLRKELEAAAAQRANAMRVTPVPASTAGDDFESGTLRNWRSDRIGAGSWFVYSNGKTPPDPAQSDTFLPFDVPDPPQGKFAAVTDMNGAGRRILFRDITLDGRYRLHVTVFYVNASGFSPTNLSRRDTIGDEQQYRIDVIQPLAPLTTTAKDHVLATIFQGRPNDPQRIEPTRVSIDLSPWAGQTVRLRLASADNQGPLRAGVDDIRFERLGK